MIYDWIYKQFYDMLYVFICLMMCEEMMNIYIYITYDSPVVFT